MSDDKQDGLVDSNEGYQPTQDEIRGWQPSKENIIIPNNYEGPNSGHQPEISQGDSPGNPIPPGEE